MTASRLSRRSRVFIAHIALAVRHHYMLGATAVVLGLAAAGGLGHFDEPTSQPQAAVRESGAPSAPVAFVPAVSRTPVPERPFEFNVFIVDSKEEQLVLQRAESQHRSPYLVGMRASEVLLVLTAEDEMYAAHHVEEVRMSFPGANVVVTDLR